MINFHQVRAVLWDLDGVLVDTGELHYHAMVSALLKYQVEFPHAVYKQTFGTTIRNVLAVTLGVYPADDFVVEVQQAQGKFFCELARGNLQPAIGARALLEFFQAAGIPQAIASSAEDFVIDVVLQETGLGGYFQEIVAGARLPSKPSPEIFLQAAKLLSVPAPACLVIEDAPAGVDGARAAGMFSLALTSSHPREALTRADMVVDSLLEVPAAASTAWGK